MGVSLSPSRSPSLSPSVSSSISSSTSPSPSSGETSFGDVFDQFMMMVKDYRLTSLYNTSVSDFETYLRGWLLPAIVEFKNCNQSLSYEDNYFAETLTRENIIILALIMKKYWLKKEINDITQMNLHIQDKDFKTFAEANNLSEKRKLYITEVEEISQKLVDYGLDNVDWSSWFSGTFYTP